MKTSGGVTSALDAVEWPASRFDHLSTEDTAIGIHWVGGLMGSKTGMDFVE